VVGKKAYQPGRRGFRLGVRLRRIIVVQGIVATNWGDGVN